MAESKADKGMEIVRKLFAGAPPSTPIPAELGRMTIEHVFGDVWQGKDLELLERSLVTNTVLVALGREAELRLHLRGARNLGIAREKLEGMITHVAHYAGWPVAVSACRVRAEVWAEMDAEQA